MPRAIYVIRGQIQYPPEITTIEDCDLHDLALTLNRFLALGRRRATIAIEPV